MEPSTHCITGLDALPSSLRGGVLTVGNFDGVHRGHQRILQTARALAAAEDALVVAMTFEPPPDAVLRPQDEPRRIVPHEEKLRLLLEYGADYVLTLPTDRAMLALSAGDFLAQIVLGRLAPRHVVEGDDFHFGRDRAGNLPLLVREGERLGIRVHAVPPAVVELPEGPRRVSSTLVRELVRAGRVEDAARSLGRSFTIFERVIPGQGQGRLLEFPTVNVDPGRQVVPGDGVYAGRARIGGATFPAAVSIGRKPTLGPVERSAVEAFLVGASGDLYQKDLALAFLLRLRDQWKFESVEDLRAQIAKDVERVREICG